MANRNSFYNQCRKEYPVFSYNGYNYNYTNEGLDISFDFSIDGLAKFHPTWHIEKIIPKNIAINRELLDEMIFSLGMVELLFYWKISCPGTVIIKDRKLTSKQIGWWKKLYFNGLGEFNYINQIDSTFEDFMSIVCNGSAKETRIKNSTDNPGLKIGHPKPAVIIPVGTGKGSCISLELLKSKAKTYCYTINPREISSKIIETAGVSDNIIHATRNIDKALTDLTNKNYLDGPTPFSAIISFSSIIAAYINDIDYVAVSNRTVPEDNSDSDICVNHLYAKTFEFESDFRSYNRKYFGSGVYYFSFLRPLSKDQIESIFKNCTAYHALFDSIAYTNENDNLPTTESEDNQNQIDGQHALTDFFKNIILEAIK